jgi:UDP-N-acetylmuramoyl-tripeptide--D-alanyl-D-alanine ligase
MGMNRKNEIGELTSIFKPQYAAITNIGTAHIGVLGSRSSIAEEKKKIFSTMSFDGVAVIPADDDFSDFLADGVAARKVFFGKNIADSGVTFISDDGLNGSTFAVDGIQVHLHLPGIYNYLNALAAIALAKNLGITAEQIRDGIESIEPIFGRSQILHGTYDILQDCYNANPDSMERAIELCASATCVGKKILILGDMLELGTESYAAHVHIGVVAVTSSVDLVIFIGFEMKAAYQSAVNTISTERLQLIYIEGNDDHAIEAAADAVKKFVQPESLVLLKASRGMSLERITPLLQGPEQKGYAHG